MNDYDEIMKKLNKIDSVSIHSIFKLIELIERRRPLPYQIDDITSFAVGYLPTRRFHAIQTKAQ